VRWVPDQVVKGIPYDTPITGYQVNTVNTLRLWKSEAPESFDFQTFNVGDYYGAVNQKIVSENISKVLYPNDEQIQGKELRLMQQFFFVSCALQDMIRIHLTSGRRLDSFHEKFAVQLNDTHPAVGVAELMRLLIDEHLPEVAHRLLTCEGYPGPQQLLADGNTTMPEHWGKSPSHLHASFSGIAFWCIHGLAGMNRPGFSGGFRL